MSLRSSGLRDCGLVVQSHFAMIPREAAAAGRDLLIRRRRLQVGILGVNLFEQIKMQRFDGFLKQSIKGQSFLFSEAGDSHSRLIQSGVGVEDMLLNADSLLAVHYFKVATAAPLMLRIDILVLVAQQILLHLAHGVARQLVDEEHALGQLELGEPLCRSAAMIAASLRGVLAGSGVTTATTPSPKSGCGTPITAPSATPGRRVRSRPRSPSDRR